MSPDPQPMNVEQRISTLTATVDQLQAEQDRNAYAITFLLLASIALAAILVIEHRRVMKLLP